MTLSTKVSYYGTEQAGRYKRAFMESQSERYFEGIKQKNSNLSELFRAFGALRENCSTSAITQL